jgi:hypothetical protein
MFESDLCRDYLLSQSDKNELLFKVCAGGVSWNAEQEKWYENTDFGEELGRLCPCFYPDEYYEWYRENELNEAQKNTIGNNVRRECYHSKCSMSGTYPGSETEIDQACPNIANCRNEINMNVNAIFTDNDPNPFGSQSFPDPSGFSSQACSFTNINATPLNDGTGANEERDSRRGTGGENTDYRSTTRNRGDGISRSGGDDGSGIFDGIFTDTDTRRQSRGDYGDDDNKNLQWILGGVAVLIILAVALIKG